MNTLPTQLYAEQAARWPRTGRHILAHWDEASVIVYQAYRPAIARWALEHGAFGGPEFSFSRMSWIKPNFLWMMYRSAWATAVGQEMVLAVRLSRSFFEQLLRGAVASSHARGSGETRDEWQARVRASEVRLQWDPDHGPGGGSLERRALQLGLRGATLRAYATSEVIEVIDMTPFVAAEREHASRSGWEQLRTPLEDVYPIADAAIAANIGIAVGHDV